MRLSSRMGLIKPSATLAINAKAMELKAKGVSVISLAVGEPDFDTPEFIREAAKKAIDEGFTRYTQVGGIPALRKAAANYFKKYHGVEAEAKNIIITNGGKQALYGIMQALLNPGDTVLIPSPYWVSYPEMATMAGATSIFVPTNIENDFKVTPDQLEASLTPDVRMLVINSPSNPSGACYSRQELDAIMEWAIGRGLFVVADEIYEQLVYAPAESASTATWWARYPEQVAIVNGLSKAYCMTGWRVGFALADAALIKAMDQMQGQVTSNVCSVAQRAALAALEGPDDSIIAMREAFKRRRDMVFAEVSTWPGVRCPKPDGSFYFFLDFTALLGPDCPDDNVMCTRLLEEAHVATVPGTAFGMPGCLRISYAVADETLAEALKRMRKVMVK